MMESVSFFKCMAKTLTLKQRWDSAVFSLLPRLSCLSLSYHFRMFQPLWTPSDISDCLRGQSILSVWAAVSLYTKLKLGPGFIGS